MLTHFRVFVRLGEHNLAEEQDCDDDDFCLDSVQDFHEFEDIVHPAYEPLTNGRAVHDIALIRLGSPADLSKNNVKTICLPITKDVHIDKISEELRNNMEVAGASKFLLV